jgi:hypothetical protein
MKNLVEITTIVNDYLDDAAADVEQAIIDSVNFLSNMFSVDSIDETQSTVETELTLDIPDDSVKIDSVFIGGEEIRKLKSLDDLQTVLDIGERRWYEFGGLIQFTLAFDAVATTQIFYQKGFTEPETAVDTDVPERMLELVYIGAQYRYYNTLITRIVTNRLKLPDVKTEDLRKVRDDIKNTYFGKIKIIQMNA